MAISLPQPFDPLNIPDHALSHRVFANDSAAPEQSVVVDSTGLTTVNSLTETIPTLLKLDQTTPQSVINGIPNFNAGLKVGGAITSFEQDGSGYTADGEMYWDINGNLVARSINAKIINGTIQISGDMRGQYVFNAKKILLDLGSLNLKYPDGITITNWKVFANTAPTTQLAGTISYCNGVTSASFPGGSPTVVDTIATTTGYQTRTDMSASTKGDGIIPSEKILYLALTADPTDYNITWTLEINFTTN